MVKSAKDFMLTETNLSLTAGRPKQHHTLRLQKAFEEILSSIGKMITYTP